MCVTYIHAVAAPHRIRHWPRLSKSRHHSQDNDLSRETRRSRGSVFLFLLHFRTFERCLGRRRRCRARLLQLACDSVRPCPCTPLSPHKKLHNTAGSPQPQPAALGISCKRCTVETRFHTPSCAAPNNCDTSKYALANMYLHIHTHLRMLVCYTPSLKAHGMPFCGS